VALLPDVVQANHSTTWQLSEVSFHAVRVHSVQLAKLAKRSATHSFAQARAEPQMVATIALGGE